MRWRLCAGGIAYAIRVVAIDEAIAVVVDTIIAYLGRTTGEGGRGDEAQRDREDS
jgi:hypothetical protein